MSSGKNRRREGGGGDSEGGSNWMDTYGDMVTLLLCFFVLLYAFSSVDSQKWQTIVEIVTGNPPARFITAIDVGQPVLGLEDTSFEVPGMKTASQKIRDDLNKLKGEYDALLESTGQSPSDPEASKKMAEIEATFKELYNMLNQYIVENGLESTFTLGRDGNYIMLIVTEGILFENASADVVESAEPYLRDIAVMLKKAENSIRMVTVEGHTDSNPITYPFKDNLDLSNMRAANVLREIKENSGVEFTKGNIFKSCGRSQWEPIADNTTIEGRQKNRRVQFVIESKNEKDKLNLLYESMELRDKNKEGAEATE